MKRTFRVWCRDTEEYDNIPLFLKPDGSVFHIMPVKNPYPWNDTIEKPKICKSKDHQVELLIGIFGEDNVEVYENDIVKIGDIEYKARFELTSVFGIHNKIIIIGNANYEIK